MPSDGRYYLYRRRVATAAYAAGFAVFRLAVSSSAVTNVIVPENRLGDIRSPKARPRNNRQCVGGGVYRLYYLRRRGYAVRGVRSFVLCVCVCVCVCVCATVSQADWHRRRGETQTDMALRTVEINLQRTHNFVLGLAWQRAQDRSKCRKLSDDAV